MLADELSDDDEENTLDDRNWGWLLRLCFFLIEALIFTEFWGEIGINLKGMGIWWFFKSLIFLLIFFARFV
jgi:hypothetical protein